MKVVKEHINEFERGKNPLDTLRIGNVAKRDLKNFLIELEDKYGGTQSFFSDNAMAVGIYSNPQPINKIRITVYLLEENDPTFFLIIEMQKLAETKDWEKIATFKFTDFNKVKEQIKACLPRKRRKKTNESINFERGQDPLDAMSIGNVLERNIKSLLKELQDEYGGEAKYDEDNETGVYEKGNKCILITVGDDPNPVSKTKQLYYTTLQVSVATTGLKTAWVDWISIWCADKSDCKQQIRNWLSRKVK